MRLLCYVLNSSKVKVNVVARIFQIDPLNNFALSDLTTNTISPDTIVLLDWLAPADAVTATDSAKWQCTVLTRTWLSCSSPEPTVPEHFRDESGLTTSMKLFRWVKLVWTWRYSLIYFFFFKHCLSLRSESENMCTYLTSVLSSPVFRAPVYLSIHHLSLLKFPLAPLYYLDPSCTHSPC